MCTYVYMQDLEEKMSKLSATRMVKKHLHQEKTDVQVRLKDLQDELDLILDQVCVCVSLSCSCARSLSLSLFSSLAFCLSLSVFGEARLKAP